MRPRNEVLMYCQNPVGRSVFNYVLSVRLPGSKIMPCSDMRKILSHGDNLLFGCVVLILPPQTSAYRTLHKRFPGRVVEVDENLASRSVPKKGMAALLEAVSMCSKRRRGPRPRAGRGM